MKPNDNENSPLEGPRTVPLGIVIKVNLSVSRGALRALADDGTEPAVAIRDTSPGTEARVAELVKRWGRPLGDSWSLKRCLQWMEAAPVKNPVTVTIEADRWNRIGVAAAGVGVTPHQWCVAGIGYRAMLIMRECRVESNDTAATTMSTKPKPPQSGNFKIKLRPPLEIPQIEVQLTIPRPWFELVEKHGINIGKEISNRVSDFRSGVDSIEQRTVALIQTTIAKWKRNVKAAAKQEPFTVATTMEAADWKALDEIARKIKTPCGHVALCLLCHAIACATTSPGR